MLRLNAARRAVVVDKGPDFANLVLGGFVLGQYVGERPVSIIQLAAALALWIGALGLVLVIAGDD